MIFISKATLKNEKIENHWYVIRWAIFKWKSEYMTHRDWAWNTDRLKIWAFCKLIRRQTKASASGCPVILDNDTKLKETFHLKNIINALNQDEQNWNRQFPPRNQIYPQ